MLRDWRSAESAYTHVLDQFGDKIIGQESPSPCIPLPCPYILSDLQSRADRGYRPMFATPRSRKDPSSPNAPEFGGRQVESLIPSINSVPPARRSQLGRPPVPPANLLHSHFVLTFCARPLIASSPATPTVRLADCSGKSTSSQPAIVAMPWAS